MRQQHPRRRPPQRRLGAASCSPETPRHRPPPRRRPPRPRSPRFTPCPPHASPGAPPQPGPAPGGAGRCRGPPHAGSTAPPPGAAPPGAPPASSGPAGGSWPGHGTAPFPWRWAGAAQPRAEPRPGRPRTAEPRDGPAPARAGGCNRGVSWRGSTALALLHVGLGPRSLSEGHGKAGALHTCTRGRKKQKPSW